MNDQCKSEDPATYAEGSQPTTPTQAGDTIIEAAHAILQKRLREPGRAITNPGDTRRFVALELAEEKAEIFSAIWLDNRHRLIAFERMFNGTVNGASVHPRELVRRAIELNAAAVIVAHNHPSGEAEPSAADRAITKRLQDAFQLIDVRVLDHIVVGGVDTVSFAERDWL
ncbi:MAG: DNA repair protein RadC [Nannocystaceae bacterium]